MMRQTSPTSPLHSHLNGTHKPLGHGSKYSKAEVLQLKAVFDQQDRNKDGKVTAAELAQTLQETNEDRHKTGTLSHREYFKVLDVNNDGVLTFDEYLLKCYPLATAKELRIMMQWAYPVKEIPPEPTFELTEENKEELAAMFRLYDKNGDCKLEYEELKDLAERCGYSKKEIEQLFVAADKDHNSTINLNEFYEMMKSSYL